MHLPRHIRPQLRPLRPPLRRPLVRKCPTKARFFTRNAQLLLVSPAVPRPQLGFLGPASGTYKKQTGPWALSRFITTDTKRFLKEQAWQGGKWTMWGTIFSALGLTWAFLATHELLDREFPAPPDWTHWSRFRYHSAKGIEVPESLIGVTDWGLTGHAWRLLLERLEDPELDGKGLLQQEEGGILVLGVGEIGLDVSQKSESWRRGYHEALMGCGRSAEHLDGKVMDVTRGNVFPPEHVIGPSNPNPKPTPPWRPSAPLEENCVPAYKAPETFYLKAITTKGFTTRQRLEAAIAYAEWLDHKGMHDTAEEMLRWAHDLATSVLPDPSATVDSRSGIVKPNAPVVTENVLAAATALAVHRAQQGDTSSALPIFLSVLRARKSAPIGFPAPVTPRAREQAAETDIAVMGNAIKSLWSLLQEAKYPPAPPTGDEPLLRTPDEGTEEAAVMLYVGEILFASAKQQREPGISWTRDAVELAEKCIKDPTVQIESKRKAVDCLSIGLDNWRTMVERVTEDLEVEARVAADPSVPKGWKGLVEAWLGWDATRRSDIKAKTERWINEEKELSRYQHAVDRAKLLDMFKRDGKPIWSTWLIQV